MFAPTSVPGRRVTVAPVALPKFKEVAALPTFKVVALVLIRLNVVAVVVRSPPLTAKSCDIVTLPSDVINNRFSAFTLAPTASKVSAVAVV